MKFALYFVISFIALVAIVLVAYLIVTWLQGITLKDILLSLGGIK